MTDFARIKELLCEWAKWHEVSSPLGYPKQSNFVTERVQSDNRSTDTYRELPAIVSKLDREIERMAPLSKKIVRAEFLERGPQKLKAMQLDMKREEFSRRLNFIYEHLHHAIWGN